LLCVGNAVADAVARPVDESPRPGRLQFVERIGLFAGGCGLNTSIAASRLGLKAGLVTALGRDGFGDFLLNRLQQEGVDIRSVSRDAKLHSSATLVSVASDGERSFLHTVGASRALSDRSVHLHTLKQYRALHLSSYYLLPSLDGPPSVRLLKRAKSAGLLTSLDTSWDPKGRWNLVLACLPQVDYFLPSFEEAARIFGTKVPSEIVAKAFRAGVRRLVVLKLGAKGCQAWERGGSRHSVRPYKVQVVDATGAGDSFDAGFMAGILKGESIARSLKLGNATGAACVAGLGAAGAIRDYAQVQTIADRL
jgi:sugar/nucleoside kinase (ribokinase family)